METENRLKWLDDCKLDEWRTYIDAARYRYVRENTAKIRELDISGGAELDKFCDEELRRLVPER